MDRISSTGTTTPENPSIQAYTHQTGSTLPFEQAIPMQFHMPFIANPFMSPFMPQHGTNAESAAASSAGANPPLPAFFFSPAQYQEMMQQYFAHMMSANHYGMNVAFPMPFTTAMARPSSQASQSDVCETVNGLHETRRSCTSSEREFSTLSTNCKSNLSSTGNFSLNRTEGGCSEQQYKSRCSPVESNLCETNGIESSFGKDSTKSDGEDVGEVTKKDLERKTSLPASDEKTTSLIRKQMSEIEKEVIRRSQNKNIKKIDDRELAELFGSSSVVAEFAPATSISELNEHTTFAPNFHSVSGEFQASQLCPSVTKESLDHLRSSFNLPEFEERKCYQKAQHDIMMPKQNFDSMQSGAVFHDDDGHHDPALGSTKQTFAVSQHFPHNQMFVNSPQPSFSARSQTDEHSKPQEIKHYHGDPASSVREVATSAVDNVATSETVVAVPSSGTLAPPPPPTRPVNRKVSQSGTQSCTSGWPDEIKEDTVQDEPVWVLRDSYLKKIQLEQNIKECVNQWNNESDVTSLASAALSEAAVDHEEVETDRLLLEGTDDSSKTPPSSLHEKKKSKESMIHEPAVLIEGVLFRARYLGSTQMMYESRGSKAARMAQAQEAVGRVKAPDGEIQPSTEIDLFISTEKIMVLNTDLQRISDTDVRQDILMDHALRTISYIADIGDVVVLMARRMSASSSDEKCDQVNGARKTPKVICHVFESEEASFIAQSIGQAFQVAYVEFLRANGIDDPSYLRQIDYQEVLNSQELLGDELEMFARKEAQKDVVVPKKNGEPLGIVVV